MGICKGCNSCFEESMRDSQAKKGNQQQNLEKESKKPGIIVFEDFLNLSTLHLFIRYLTSFFVGMITRKFRQVLQPLDLYLTKIRMPHIQYVFTGLQKAQGFTQYPPGPCGHCPPLIHRPSNFKLFPEYSSVRAITQWPLEVPCRHRCAFL